MGRRRRQSKKWRSRSTKARAGSAAAINSGGDKYAWRIFSTSYAPRSAGYTTVLARATDDQGNVQPIVPPWNPLGYFWNGIHRVGFMVEA